MHESQVIDWLLEGDPAIRWQTLRDLCGAPQEHIEAERSRVASEGWGARFLALQSADGMWGGGLYSPKWISTTYTMLDLKHLGLMPGHPQAIKACDVFLEHGFYPPDGGINFFARNWTYSETCITGMILSLLAYFRHPDERLHTIVQHLLGQQMADGGWNCERPKGATHSSFHTTLSVLEGLLEYRRFYPQNAAGLAGVIERGHEFLLLHHLFRSHRTGEVVDQAMLRMPFPPRWKYDTLRVLDYFQAAGVSGDERMQEAVDLLKGKQTKDGRWKQNSTMTGLTHFQMEQAGQPGRFNTLRALRVLRWWEMQV